jgi:hypothetical protein
MVKIVKLTMTKKKALINDFWAYYKEKNRKINVKLTIFSKKIKNFALNLRYINYLLADLGRFLLKLNGIK